MSETGTRDLSPAETLALRAQGGDDAAAAQLVRDHAPLAFKLGQRYRHAVGEENDWRQLCCLALLVAARRWQPGRAAFSTYVGLTVRYTFGRHFRSARWFGGPQNDPATRRTPTHSLDEPISADEPAAGKLADLLQADARTDPYALACAAERRRGVALALQRITPRSAACRSLSADTETTVSR